MAELCPPADDDDWTALTGAPLPVGAAAAWAVVPHCGGVVMFTGTVRDHAGDRQAVTGLAYEAYDGPAAGRLRDIAAEARVRWPSLGRVALLHRIGRLDLCDAAVVVVVSAPHRGEAFEAARWCIDTIKATVPIWKKEEWAGGSDWGTGALPIGGRSVQERPTTTSRST
jgi:molybdopterin synthase catalytic subunit